MRPFFQRVTRLTPPQEPIEGIVKLILLSQLITVPMTLTMDFDSSDESIAASVRITLIHLFAMVAGLTWGGINWCLQTDEQEQREDANLFRNR